MDEDREQEITQDEPDVEGHKRPHTHEPAESGFSPDTEDDGPDVEGHKRPNTH